MEKTLQHPIIMPRTPFSILFVCLGNICRSPAGENILRHQVTQAGLAETYHIDSAGTHDYHPGKPPDHRMCQTLQKRNIPTTGKARQFKKEDFKKFDLILAMDTENYANIIALDPQGAFHDKVTCFTSYCTKPEYQTPSVPDPYYGENDGFELVADMLEDGCAQIIQSLSSD